ncbi:cytochrome d ubiquinol oxidase subunit II [Cellulomonas marina]|uniref:Cytochrome d ubiquinol oxidase subunit II n=1 Tax=Cellulomonas marina TaxID=988821 RepID=A0A1I0YSG0_9CELL|nr:cytochrome d ubiquinol oxidase subunit II [Cellulomonas marina]GIG27591.1 cytochrome c oxidase assembly protein [Cellulomonas marina]SFB15238.1 cytochrome d ubiquinol oxidase subunit II [Cellulomonas marina]
MSHEALQITWFVLIAVLWTGYLVLEGFDFGVGMLLPFVGRDERERRVMINTIGPVWDGNEVWLLTAGGATFAAFPEWYATLFSGAYLALVLVLLALIVRVVAFEWRGKIASGWWQATHTWALVVGSWVPAVLWGVAFGNLVAGMRIEPVVTSTSNVEGETTRNTLQYTGSFLDLLTNGHGFALLTGVVTACIFLTHGSVFLALKSDGVVRRRAGELSGRLSVLTLGVGAVWAIWLQLEYSGKAWTWVPLVVAAAALAAGVLFTRTRQEGRAFVASAVGIVAAVVLIFGSLFPDVMPSSVDPAYSLTIHNASSSAYTLGVMTWVAVLLTPVVLVYQAWTYWVFRKRVSVEHIPTPTTVTFANARRDADAP